MDRGSSRFLLLRNVHHASLCQGIPQKGSRKSLESARVLHIVGFAAHAAKE